MRCVKCNFQAYYDQQYQDHIATHTEDVSKCKCCSYVTFDKDDLLIHFRVSTVYAPSRENLSFSCNKVRFSRVVACMENVLKFRMFSNKIVVRAGILNMLFRIAHREDPDQMLLQKQSGRLLVME